jgi:hypothetical protein
MSTVAEKPETTPRRRPYSTAGRPECPDHGDSMCAGSSTAKITYFYCSVEGCRHSAKLPRIYNDVNESHRDAP